MTRSAGPEGRALRAIRRRTSGEGANVKTGEDSGQERIRRSSKKKSRDVERRIARETSLPVSTPSAWLWCELNIQSSSRKALPESVMFFQRLRK